MTRHLTDRREEGFTLVELLVAISILGIISAPLMLGLMTGFRFLGHSDERFNDSRSALISAAYFANDVADANTMLKTDPSACGGGSALVSFTSSDASAGFGAAANNKTSYVYDATDATNKKLVRTFCANGGAATQSIAAVSLNAAPVVTCYNAANVVNSTCVGATWVKIVITQKANTKSPDIPVPVAYVYTLEGTREVAMNRARSRHVSSEAGASLIIALTMVTLIGVSLVAALGFGTTSLRTVSAIDSQRTAAYAADSAMQTAIQVLRENASAGSGAAGAACPTTDYAAAGGQPDATITCQIVSPSPTGLGDSMPPYAILALGNSSAETGIKLTATGTLTLAGPLASNSPAVAATNSVTAGILDLTGYTLDANGTCSGTYTLTAPGDKRCSNGVTYSDPGYPSQPLTNILLNVNPAPTCAADGAVLQFSPGYYTNKAVLTPASTVAGFTANGNACTVNYLYFQPGVYYFDFGFDPAFTTKVWAVAANQTVVGGEPKGWDPNVAGSLPPTPGGGTSAACKTGDDGATSGVQFVFGGASQMTVVANNSSVELCADPTPVGTNQQIAIYGQQTGDDPTPQNATLAPADAVPTQAGWTNVPTNVLPISPATTPIDAQLASYTLPSTSPASSASVSSTGYPRIPAGSINVTATLEVAHQEVGAATANVATFPAMTITSSTGATCTTTAPTKHFATSLTPPIATDSIVLSAACKTVIASGDFSITYTAKAATNKSYTEYFDGIDVVVTYTPPAVRAESGCVVSVTVSPCDVFKVGTGSAELYLWGTLYAPLARVTATFVSTGNFEFRRGVIVRSLVNSGTPPADSTRSFCLGTGSPCVGPGHVLLLTATVGGSVELRVLVQIADSPVSGDALQILSWNVVRG